MSNISNLLIATLVCALVIVVSFGSLRKLYTSVCVSVRAWITAKQITLATFVLQGTSMVVSDGVPVVSATIMPDKHYTWEILRLSARCGLTATVEPKHVTYYKGDVPVWSMAENGDCFTWADTDWKKVREAYVPGYLGRLAPFMAKRNAAKPTAHPASTTPEPPEGY